tara:strand:- start:125 stop:397 length:273 start_codon:yes stop_codon:yes gene_type:complete
MPAHIVKVVPARLDKDCMEITLRLLPGKIGQWIGRKEKTITFKGQGNDWYRYPCYTPASGKMAKFLKSIYRGWEYRHIQYRFKQSVRKAS